MGGTDDDSGARPEVLPWPYFSRRSWSSRLDAWRRTEEVAGKAFARSNEGSIRRRLADADTAAHVVVNMRTESLRDFLRTGVYRNVYELARVGGKAPADHRVQVDERCGIGPDTWFAAVSLGGSGLRYFGEHCLVLSRRCVEDNTRLLDRDSYDVLFDPLDSLPREDVLELLGGTWAEVDDMILMRVLPRIPHDFQIVTSGTVIELALTDQEYIEVHLDRSFRPTDVEQVLDSPDASATESRILERERRGLSNSMHELRWARLRAELAAELDRRDMRQRVVTQHGRGYQWA